MKVKIHPLADLWPPMDEALFEKLKEDIAANGLERPIVLWEGQLIDGRARLRACNELGIKCRAEEHHNSGPFSVVFHLNGNKPYSAEQRAIIAAKVANMYHYLPIEKIAFEMATSKGWILLASEVIDKGAAELARAVKFGTVSLTLAAELIEVCEDQTEQAELALEGEKAIREFLASRIACPYPGWQFARQ